MTDNSKIWRRYIFCTLGLYVAVAMTMFSYGLAEYYVLDRIVPNYPYYTDEDTEKMFASLYGYTSEITQYAAHPVTVVVNSTMDAMREDVSDRAKNLLDNVFTIIENLLIIAAAVSALLAVRVSSFRKQRYVALALAILPIILVIVFLVEGLSLLFS